MENLTEQKEEVQQLDIQPEDTGISEQKTLTDDDDLPVFNTRMFINKGMVDGEKVITIDDYYIGQFNKPVIDVSGELQGRLTLSKSNSNDLLMLLNATTKKDLIGKKVVVYVTKFESDDTDPSGNKVTGLSWKFKL